jgi:hypothetical protein
VLLRRYHDDAPPEGTSDTTENGSATAPARSASKADWVAYATARGAEQAATEQLTKEQLIEQYGG